MITREEYLNALEIVDQYNRQLNLSDVMNRAVEKTLVDDWIIKNYGKITGRLIKCLENTEGWGHGGDRLFKYMEDINERSFMRGRGNGKKSWYELKDVLSES